MLTMILDNVSFKWAIQEKVEKVELVKQKGSRTEKTTSMWVHFGTLCQHVRSMALSPSARQHAGDCVSHQG